MILNDKFQSALIRNNATNTDTFVDVSLSYIGEEGLMLESKLPSGEEFAIQLNVVQLAEMIKLAVSSFCQTTAVASDLKSDVIDELLEEAA